MDKPEINLAETIANTQKTIRNYNLHDTFDIITTPKTTTVYGEKIAHYFLPMSILIVLLPPILTAGAQLSQTMWGDKTPPLYIAAAVVFNLLCWLTGLWFYLKATQRKLTFDFENHTLEIADTQAYFKVYNTNTIIAFKEISRLDVVEVMGQDEYGPYISAYNVTVWTNKDEQLSLMKFGLTGEETIFKNAVIKLIEAAIIGTEL